MLNISIESFMQRPLTARKSYALFERYQLKVQYTLSLTQHHQLIRTFICMPYVVDLNSP